MKKEQIPQDWLNLCSRDMLFVYEHLRSELPALRKLLVGGKVNGGIEQVCNAIPFYEKGLHNYGEQWFYNIRIGDTPENSFFAKHAVDLIDMALRSRRSD